MAIGSTCLVRSGGFYQAIEEYTSGVGDTLIRQYNGIHEVSAADRTRGKLGPDGVSMTSTTSQATWHATTILTVRKGGKVVIAGDGQVSMGETVVKQSARKVRPLGDGSVISGFAGATADAFTLFERLEKKLDQYPGQLMRAAVELAKDWRTDRYLRHLQALMLVADKDTSLMISGNGDVLEPEGGVAGIGSGGNYALAAARALYDTDLDAETIARRAMAIAAEICVYTNDRLNVESLDVA
jgi:ATP-dependent HslUV protease, peptidase subunit HslV